jgi:hypothetical protein
VQTFDVVSSKAIYSWCKMLISTLRHETCKGTTIETSSSARSRGFYYIKNIMKYKVKKRRPTWPKIGTLYKNSTIIPCFPIKYVLNPIDGDIPFPNTQLTESQLEEYFEPVKERLMCYEDLKWVKGYAVWAVDQIIKFEEHKKLYTKMIRPTKEMAEAQLALSQLMQLRDAWRDGWTPSPWDNIYAVSIKPYNWEEIWIHSISFGDEKSQEIFEETFKDLIDKIKPLYFS